MFSAILVDKQDNQYRSQLTRLDESQLPDGDVAVEVAFSTLNYKDALAISGQSPVVRQFPMVPGIDFAGTVTESRHPRFRPGDKVLLNGWGVGEKHWGGLAQKARVSGDWLIPLPAGLDERQTMAVGTAGYTAMLAVMALEEQGVTLQRGPVLVTGANGGVGHYAIAFLARLGFEVAASTGRVDQQRHLLELGAKTVIDRQTLAQPGRPLAKEQWAAAIDSVGSHTLANVCAGIAYGGAVAACGLAQGMDFPGTVAPFILRGVTLRGIDSVMCPLEKRQQAWQRIAALGDSALFDAASRVIGLSDAIDAAGELLAGRVRGRVVVDVNR